MYWAMIFVWLVVCLMIGGFLAAGNDGSDE